MLYGEREAQGQREVVRQPLAAFVAQHHCTQPLALLSAGGVQSLVDEHVVEPKLREVHLVRVDARGHGRAALRAHVVQRRVEQRLHRRVVHAGAAAAEELLGKRRGVRPVADDLRQRTALVRGTVETWLGLGLGLGLRLGLGFGLGG